jgi:NADPH2:quinone reductase
MSGDVPSHALQLRSLVTAEGVVELSLAEVEVPEPRPGQVLVRVEASPVNPSDLGLLLGGADVGAVVRGGTADRPVLRLPLAPPAQRMASARVGQSLPVGNEGAGTVVTAGDDPAAQALLGRVVAVAGGAMWSQYRCVDASACLPLPDGVTAAEGAASFVNPMTVLGMIGTMRAEGHTALVHTAAASNLGRMLNRVCLEDGIGLVNVVRSDAQVQLLRAAGAEHVCDSSSGTFMADLVAAIGATGATLAFDAVGGGTLASRILSAMEAVASAGAEFSRYGSTVHKQLYIYGGLDRGPTELTRSFGFAWGIGGWLLTPYLQTAGAEEIRRMQQRVATGITTTFASHYTDRVSLAGALDPGVVAAYAAQATGSKHLITPNS